MENGYVCPSPAFHNHDGRTNSIPVLHQQLERFPELLHRSLGQRLLGRQRLSWSSEVQ
jgi:hypothetical protein